MYPVNDPELVDALGKRLECDLDQVISLVNIDGEKVNYSLIHSIKS